VMELTNRWVNCQLGDIVTLRNGYAFKSEEYQEHGVPIIRISDINDSVVEISNSKNIYQHEEFEKYTVNCGDILIAMSGATTGKFGIYKGIAKAYQNQRVGNLLLVSEANTNKTFIYYLLFSLKRRIEKDAYGGAQPNISGNKVEAIEIELPPLNEQHRIVAKIEELFSELDKGIENLKTAREQLKVYRQALLKHAFEGKLTAQWRAENQNKLETADALLKRIQQERTQRYQQQLTDWQATGGSKPKAPKSLPPLTAEELAELPKLPEGWGWVKVGNVGSVGTGITPLKGRSDFYANGNIPWVTSGALNENFVTKASDFVTDLALKETNLRIYPKHTLLIALYGEGKTRGKCSELLIEATTNQAIAAIVQEGISENLRKYMKWFFQKNYGDIRLKSSGGVQPNLNLSIIENTLFPMCSIEEATQVVDAIESKLSEVDQLDQTIATSLQQAEALRQSILKKAFSGQLVPQDPHDEPASELLVRIKSERDAQSAKPKLPKATRKSL
jgi:type I restriction enzyme S subunit